MLHFDYLFIGETDKDEKYVLLVVEDLSGYCWIELSASANSEHVAEVLFRWTSAFTAPEVWVSDQGSHFKNEVLE